MIPKIRANELSFEQSISIKTGHLTRESKLSNKTCSAIVVSDKSHVNSTNVDTKLLHIQINLKPHVDPKHDYQEVPW